MTIQMNTKFRLVTCPSCRNVLLEWPDIPVYKCGGCDAVLQAKNWKDDINATELSSRETDSSWKNENDSVSKSSNQKATVPHIESSVESDIKGDQTEIGNRDMEERGDSNTSDELPGSTKLCSRGNDELCLEVKESIAEGDNKCPLDQDARECGNMSLDRNHDHSGDINSFDELPCPYELSFRENEESLQQISETLKQDEDRRSLKFTGEYENESQDGCSEGTGDRTFSAELPRSAQLTCHTIEISSPGGTGCDKLDKEDDVLEPYERRDQDEHRDQQRESVEGNTFLVKTSSESEGIHHQSEQSTGVRADAEGDESRYLPQQNNDKNQPTLTDQLEVSSDDASFLREVSSSTVVACRKVEKSSMEEEANRDMNKDQMNIFKTSEVEGSLSPKKEESIVAAQSSSSESILSENISPDNKHLEQSHTEAQDIDRVRTVDTFESLPLSPRPELGSMSKSPKRTHYVDDASVTSYEGTDDEFSNQYSHLYERKFKATCSLSSNKSSRKDRYGVKKTRDGELEMHRQPTHSSSMFIGEKTHGITGGDWRLDELPEPRRHDHAIRSRTQLDKLDRVSKMPYNSRSLQLVHGNGSPSNYQQNVYQQRSGFSPPDTNPHGELDKMQLLRMVYELKDKLKQTHISKQTANGRFSAKHLKEKKHPGNYTRGIRWPQHSKISRMSFPGEAAKCRRQVHCLCSHCCHQDWQCSTPLPSHTIRCSDRQYTNYPSYICRNAFPSCSWSPQHYISSEFSSSGRETKVNNRKHSKHNKPHRLYKGEKQCVAKRHLMPIAAGSPIIACWHCSEVLQLPVDFLVFKRRCHQLRCNSCSRILKFSLQKRSHLVPYVHDAPAPPPSEMDDNSYAINSRAMATTSHSNSFYV